MSQYCFIVSNRCHVWRQKAAHFIPAITYPTNLSEPCMRSTAYHADFFTPEWRQKSMQDIVSDLSVFCQHDAMLTPYLAAKSLRIYACNHMHNFSL